MPSVRPKQKHLAVLDPCPQCGGLRYLFAREYKGSFSIQVKCFSATNWQTYKSVAVIRKAALNPHDKRNRLPRDAASAPPAEREHRGKTPGVVTLAR